jgi:hypothetical protein
MKDYGTMQSDKGGVSRVHPRKIEAGFCEGPGSQLPGVA